MRIWDIPPDKLCRNHLLGEHRELHALWSIIINNKKAYSNHPETLRWKDKLRALHLRHEKLVEEMDKRGYNHQSPLDVRFATGSDTQDEFIDSYEKQVKILKEKNCGCSV
ncbi:conserved hypothetical protein [Methanohalobium evestigatum Z-7303]|uniref:Pyrimidine dimer DNA glycosylase n=1 Tax=Methanohalobium evestigatum (strain ATCC BAA-1072 / DSM 3721 / NBRC 107634 / OCM 161 / Z-7303) TaxID=644295 RepID=D7EAE8_METEZ|nr:pyrimidine dimer DNA glycosylase/endonuclease V [Methanohalobium evestigatum]ADI74947.1 conserved hypothetical protein [Methanohalobium evestigatum Z-7303]